MKRKEVVKDLDYLREKALDKAQALYEGVANDSSYTYWMGKAEAYQTAIFLLDKKRCV